MEKECKHLIIEKEPIPNMNETVNLYNCALKMRSKENQDRIYSVLFDKGIESSFYSHYCPYKTCGKSNQIADCPFRNEN